jgi:hypothetical protein
VTPFELAGFIITSIGTACWAICFWWMHRISKRQDSMLAELHEVTRRIEHVAKEEHELIREVHPGVEDIKKSVEGVADAVSRDESARR